jgi:hypothetical protein
MRTYRGIISGKNTSQHTASQPCNPQHCPPRINSLMCPLTPDKPQSYRALSCTQTSISPHSRAHNASGRGRAPHPPSPQTVMVILLRSSIARRRRRQRRARFEKRSVYRKLGKSARETVARSAASSAGHQLRAANENLRSVVASEGRGHGRRARTSS